MTRRTGRTRRRRHDLVLRTSPLFLGLQHSAFRLQHFFQEAWIVSKRSVLTCGLVLIAAAFGPDLVVYAQGAQEPAASANSEVVRWSIIAAGFTLAFAAGLRAPRRGHAGASA